MRIKTFTLLLLASLVSIASFAQKPVALNRAMMQNASFQRPAKVSMLASKGRQKGAQAPVTSKKAPAKAPAIVTPPEDGEVIYYNATGTSYLYMGTGWSDPNAFKRTVSVIWDGIDDVYIMGLSHYVRDKYIHGTFQDATHVVFPMGQYLGDDLGVDLFACAQDNDGNYCDILAEYDEDSDTFTFTTIIADCSEENGGGKYAYIDKGLVVSAIEGTVDLPVEAPEDLTVMDYIYSATDYYKKTPVSYGVELGFYGSDVYLKGICADMPEAWIKGILEGSQITFPTGQILGNMGSYDLWFLGLGDNGVEDMVFEYDAEQGILTSDQLLVICIDKENIDGGRNCWSIHSDPITIQLVSEKAGTPDNPSVSGINFSTYGDVLELNIPLVDTDGNALVASKLSYKIYCDKGNGEPVLVTFSPEDYIKLEEDMTEIPFTFTDKYDFEAGPNIYLNLDHEDWKRIGVQSIYYGGDEKHESEIGWYVPLWPQTTTLPAGLTITTNTFKGATLDYDDEDNEIEVPFERMVNIAKNGDELYIQGLGTEDETAWVKGVKTATDTYTFARGQEMGSHGTYRLLLVGVDEENETVSDVTLKVQGDVYVFQNDFLENAGRIDRSNYYKYFYAGATIAIEGEEVKPDAPVEAPEDLVAVSYLYEATDILDKAEVTRTVQVGFYGENEIYVQGVSTQFPEAWIKGTVDGNQITFPTGQMLGEFDKNETTYTFWFLGYGAAGVQDAVFTYDAEAKTITSNGSMVVVCLDKTSIQGNLVSAESGVVISMIIEKATIPATPSISEIEESDYGDILAFNIPVVDVNGDGLLTDKLSYKLYYDNGDGEAQPVTLTTDFYEKLTEDMTEIPYGFTDEWDIYADGIYLNMDYSSWKRIGIQSIYTGGGETNVSEIGWYSMPDAISSIFTDMKNGDVRYNLAGQRVDKNFKGIFIENGKKYLKK